MDTPAQPPAYKIVTARLVIRCYAPTDAPLLKAAIDASLPHLRPWMPWARTEPRPLAEKVALLRRFRGMYDLGQDFIVGVFNHDETELLGGSGLHPRVEPSAREIGYWIRAGHTGKGYATEVAAALVRVGFEVEHLRRIEIRCSPDNAASAAVPRKLGFVHEGTLRARFDDGDGHMRDTAVFSLFAADYPASPCVAAPVRAFDAAGGRLL